MSEPCDFNALLKLMRALRDSQSGCPWALTQDFDSVAPHTIEEAYEVAEAIRSKDLPGLKDELGDLLFQVVFHAQMAEELNAFDMGDVTRSICEKLITRNAHIFGDAGARTATEQTQAWEEIKDEERAKNGAGSLMDGIPAGLPELQRSIKLQQRAARAGFDWDSPEPIIEKLREETGELVDAMTAGEPSEIENELGDLLFAVTNLARQLNVNPGAALRSANAKFERRFRAMETVAGSYARLRAMELDELESLWQQVKKSIMLDQNHE